MVARAGCVGVEPEQLLAALRTLGSAQGHTTLADKLWRSSRQKKSPCVQTGHRPPPKATSTNTKGHPGGRRNAEAVFAAVVVRPLLPAAPQAKVPRGVPTARPPTNALQVGPATKRIVRTQVCEEHLLAARAQRRRSKGGHGNQTRNLSQAVLNGQRAEFGFSECMTACELRHS